MEKAGLVILILLMAMGLLLVKAFIFMLVFNVIAIYFGWTTITYWIALMIGIAAAMLQNTSTTSVTN